MSIMNVVRDSITPSTVLCCYFSSLFDSPAQWWGRIACILGAFALHFVILPHGLLQSSATLRLVCTAIQLVASGSLFFLVLQFNYKESPSERIFQMESAFSIALLGFMRVVSAHASDVLFQVMLHCILAPVGMALLIFSPIQEARSRSNPMDPSTAEAWSVFLLLSMSQLLLKPHYNQNAPFSFYNLAAKTLALCLSMGLFQVMRGCIASFDGQMGEDYAFFYSISNGAANRVFLLLFSCMYTARWFQEAVETLNLQTHLSPDGDDAQYGLALCGIVLSLYCSMSATSSQQQHGNRMLHGLSAAGLSVVFTSILQFAALSIKEANYISKTGKKKS